MPSAAVVTIQSSTFRPTLTSSACPPAGASEISDACKPLKKRSRASTDVEMASSQYRDTSDSDSRGLNDPQVGCVQELSDHLFVLISKTCRHTEACLYLTGFVREEPRQSSSSRCRRFRHAVCGLWSVPSGRQHREGGHSLPGQQQLWDP